MMYNTAVLVVGLTGNYGMGKSTVLGIFRELGAVTLKADEIVGSLLSDREIVDRMREILGADVFAGGTLDKGKVADLIFRSKELKDRVESLLHPLVFKLIDDFLVELARGCGNEGIVVIEIPLLFEKKYKGKIGKTVTVFTDEDTALKRLEKAGMSREDGKARLMAQMPIQKKIRMSDFTVDNNGSPEETRAQVQVLYKKLLQEAGRLQ